MSDWIFVTVLFVWAVWFVFNEWWRVAPVRRRHNHETLWLAAVPAADQSRVDALLSLICDAFLIPRRYRFRLRPSDDVHTFYRRNMRGQVGDSLEYLHLVRRLERDFGVATEPLLTRRPCTVGMLVRSITHPKRDRSPIAPHGRPGTPSGSPELPEEPPSAS